MDQSSISFKKIVCQGVEFRYDPLTRTLSRINPERAKRLKHTATGSDLNKLLEDSRSSCPFCPERVEAVTPNFSPEICPDGKIRLGEVIAFPNLNPFGENHAVAILTKDHALFLDRVPEDSIANSLFVTQEYCLRLNRKNPTPLYPLYLWNYMPPSAGSLPHPHIQVLVEREPFPELANLILKSRGYFRKWKRNYWSDLVAEEEKRNERFIARKRSLSVLASFAPRGFREVLFVFQGVSSLLQMKPVDVQEFSSCLTRILLAYHTLGVGSFNLVLYSGRIGEEMPYFSLNAKLISRPFPAGVYTNDTGPLERLCGTYVIDTLPEEVAASTRLFF